MTSYRDQGYRADKSRRTARNYERYLRSRPALQLFGGDAERIDEEVTDNGVIFCTQLSGSRVHRLDDRVKAMFHHKFGLLDGICQGR